MRSRAEDASTRGGKLADRLADLCSNAPAYVTRSRPAEYPNINGMADAGYRPETK